MSLISTLQSIGLRGFLSSGDPKLRKQAAKSLGNIKDILSVRPLIASLVDSDRSVRYWAAHSLGKLGCPAALPALRAREYEEQDGFVRAWCIAGQSLITPLIDMDVIRDVLRHGSDGQRRDAAARLHGLRFSIPPPLLKLMLQMDDPIVRQWAALDAFGLPADEAAALLIGRDDDDDRTREYICWALGQGADQRASPYLTERLYHDSSPRVRETAARSLAAIHRRLPGNAYRAIDSLAEAFQREADVDAQEAIIEAAGMLPDPKAVEFLLPLIGRSVSPEICRTAVRALARHSLVAPLRIQEHFLEVLHAHEEPMIKIEALKALSDLECPGIDRLIEPLASNASDSAVSMSILELMLHSHRNGNIHHCDYYSNITNKIEASHLDTFPEVFAEVAGDLGHHEASARHFEHASTLHFSARYWLLARSAMEQALTAPSLKQRMVFLERAQAFLIKQDGTHVNAGCLSVALAAHLALVRGIRLRLSGAADDAWLCFNEAGHIYQQLKAAAPADGALEVSCTYLEALAFFELSYTPPVADEAILLDAKRRLLAAARRCADSTIRSFANGKISPLSQARDILAFLDHPHLPSLPFDQPLLIDRQAVRCDIHDVDLAPSGELRIAIRTLWGSDLSAKHLMLECVIPQLGFVRLLDLSEAFSSCDCRSADLTVTTMVRNNAFRVLTVMVRPRVYPPYADGILVLPAHSCIRLDVHGSVASPVPAQDRPQSRALVEPSAYDFSVTAALEDVLSLNLTNISSQEADIIRNILGEVESSYDISHNQNGRKLFRTVLFYTIRFLVSRLNSGAGQGYLFERSDGTLPREADLHNDYYGFMMSNIAATEIEANNVAGGRADVSFILGGERIITEVKRSNGNCSFETLVERYAAQATEYQNSGLRISFLLVLILDKPYKSGAPHISELVRLVQIRREGETHPRWLVTVKVHGRRFRPSDLSNKILDA